MTDQTNVPTPEGGNGGGTNPQGNGNGGQAPSNPNNQSQPTTPSFDPSKISDEDFGKIFDDKRVFQHSRFKELNDKANKAKELEAAEAQRKEEELKKKGEFETLAKQKEQEATDLRTQLATERMNNAILAASSKLGVVDPDAVLKLVDRSAITIDASTGAVTGVDDAINTLVTAKPYLAGKKPVTKVGNSSNPGDQNTGQLKRFKHSEIQNPEFYRANEKDILASMKAGLIENDL